MAISGWTVRPGARSVTAATRAEGFELETRSEKLAGAVTDGAEVSGSTLVAGALERFHDEYLGKVMTLAAYRVHNVANEGDKVINEWENASERMALAAIREMGTVPTTAEDTL